MNDETETECPQKRTTSGESEEVQKKLLYMECHTCNNLAGKSIMKNEKKTEFTYKRDLKES